MSQIEPDGAPQTAEPASEARLTDEQAAEITAQRGQGQTTYRATVPDLEGSSTAWLQQSSPQVANRWPDAPLNASWLDWRRQVGRDHMSVLDRAYRTVVEETRARRNRMKEGEN